MDLSRANAFVFDLDGTLVDTVETRIVAWLRTFEEFRIPADRGQIARLIGSDGKHVAQVVGQAAGVAVDSARAEEIDKRAGDIYSELNTDPKPLRGAIELLHALDDRGLLWAVATSSRRAQVGVSIDALRLSRRPIVIDGSQVTRAKPAPDLLIVAARELGVEPAASWYVGDAVWDMQAANAAGMPAIGVATGSATAGELSEAGASYTVGDLVELIPWLPDASSGRARA